MFSAPLTVDSRTTHEPACHAFFSGLALLAAGRTRPSPIRPRGTRKFGDYLIHYNALSTAGPQRRHGAQVFDRALGQARHAQHLGAEGRRRQTATAVTAEISGEATNLTGQKSPITIREIPDQYVSYVGLFEVAPPDTYTFDAVDQAGRRRSLLRRCASARISSPIRQTGCAFFRT